MKPCNFPERRNRRRKAALARLPSARPDIPALDAETLALYERIVPSALLVVTRKFGGPNVVNRPTRKPKTADLTTKRDG